MKGRQSMEQSIQLTLYDYFHDVESFTTAEASHLEDLWDIACDDEMYELAEKTYAELLGERSRSEPAR